MKIVLIAVVLSIIVSYYVSSTAGNKTQILNGAYIPLNDIGNNGDYFLHTGNDDLYTKNNGIWVIICNLRGATGERGEQGEKGDKGDPGVIPP